MAKIHDFNEFLYQQEQAPKLPKSLDSHNTSMKNNQSKEIVEVVHDYLYCIQSQSLGITDGKAAALIFLSLRSELYDDERDREVAQELFVEIMRTLSEMGRSPDRIFLTGDTGAVRAITFLMDLGIIERSPEIDLILRKNLDRKTSVNSIPSIPVPDPDIYGEAIAYLSLLREGEHTPQRYSLQEYLISLTDQCLRLLTEPVPPLYRPEDMRPSFMHSILRFADGILGKGIYPFKARRIISLIRSRRQAPSDFTEDRDIHTAILDFLAGDRDAVSRHLRQADTASLPGDLSILSRFSIVYSRPELLSAGLAEVGEVIIKDMIGDTSPESASRTFNLASGLMYLELVRRHSRETTT